MHVSRPPIALPADLVLEDGTIYTVDPDRSIAQCVAVTGDTIVYVGDNDGATPLVGESTRVIDLHGKLVLPAFVDSHCHATSGVSELYEVILHGLGSVEACRQAIVDFRAARLALRALQGAGWSNAIFGPQGPTADLLDDLASDIPAVLSSEDYHSAWVNTRALELAGIGRDTPDPAGGIIERDGAGNPTGTLRESAMDLVEDVIPPYSREQLVEGLRRFQSLAHSLGITTVYHPDLPRKGETEVPALHAFEASGDMALRICAAVTLEPTDDPSVAADLAAMRQRESGRLFRINGAKIFMDGVLEGGTAYLEEPYRHRPDRRGELLWDPPHYDAMCAALDRAGIQIHVHSIGNAATRTALDGLAFAREVNGARDARHMITHLQLVSRADVARFADLRVVAVPQPYWFVIDMYYDQAIRYLGQHLADQMYPMRTFFERGVVVASASDYPVTRPPNPLEGIEMGVTRTVPAGNKSHLKPDFERPLVPAERATVEQMIESFTLNGAYACFLEEEIGSVEVGKKADLIVLDRDILRIPPKEIHGASVILTFFEGREVYRSESFHA
jgi:predicted amidohydrolase YtcJ